MMCMCYYIFFCLGVFQPFMQSCADSSLEVSSQFADLDIFDHHHALLFFLPSVLV